MAGVQKLANPPIQEAIIHIGFDAQEHFHVSALSDLAKSLKPRFEVVKELNTEETTLTWRAGSKPFDIERSPRSLEKVILERPGLVVQLMRAGLTVSHINKYRGWESLFEDTRETFEDFVNFSKPASVTKVACKYVNVLMLPKDTANLNDWLNVGELVPPSPNLTVTGFRTEAGWYDDAAKIRGWLRIRSERQLFSNPPKIILDVEAFKSVAMPSKFDEVASLLARLRDKKNEVFFGSVTERMVGTFK